MKLKGHALIGAVFLSLVLLILIFSKMDAVLTLSDEQTENSQANTAGTETEDLSYHMYESEVDYSDTYPYYGMREDDLKKCVLGNPVKIEPCRDFNALRIERKYKTYEFGTHGQPYSGSISVVYRWHRNHQAHDYIDYPLSNGYVAWGYYIDGSGISYDIDLHGTKKRFKVWSRDPYNSNTTHHKAAQGDGETEFDPDDHDIESYYEDHKDEFDSIDEAYDAFEDDESAWDDY